MMHARLRRCCDVCDNTAAVMLGVGKGIYACSKNQSRAGVISSRLPTRSSWPEACAQLAPVPACHQCAKCIVGDD